jgi:hypothetical protein
MSGSEGSEPPARPPYRCERTMKAGDCLKFYWNEAAQAYNRPAGGQRVKCRDCAYFFGSEASRRPAGHEREP